MGKNTLNAPSLRCALVILQTFGQIRPLGQSTFATNSTVSWLKLEKALLAVVQGYRDRSQSCRLQRNIHEKTWHRWKWISFNCSKNFYVLGTWLPRSRFCCRVGILRVNSLWRKHQYRELSATSPVVKTGSELAYLRPGRYLDQLQNNLPYS